MVYGITESRTSIHRDDSEMAVVAVCAALNFVDKHQHLFGSAGVAVHSLRGYASELIACKRQKSLAVPKFAPFVHLPLDFLSLARRQILASLSATNNVGSAPAKFNCIVNCLARLFWLV